MLTSLTNEQVATAERRGQSLRNISLPRCPITKALLHGRFDRDADGMWTYSGAIVEKLSVSVVQGLRMSPWAGEALDDILESTVAMTKTPR